MKPWLVVRKQFFFPTEDNWQSNYPGNTVLVRICEGWHPKHKYVHNLLIGAWGTKEFGLYQWVKADIFNMDRKRRELIMSAANFPQPLSIKWLREYGLKYY
jgi:hypothetical protein